MAFEKKILQQLQDSISTKQKVIASCLPSIKVAAEICIRAYQQGHKTLWCGNGGSAADCIHMAAELVARYKRERKGMPAIALMENVSSLTAWSNDYNYESAFARQVEAFGQTGDVLIGITTSGTSKNVVQAWEKAAAMGIMTIALTGQKGEQIRDKVDVLIAVPSLETPRIQESHLVIEHILCDLIEASFVR